MVDTGAAHPGLGASLNGFIGNEIGGTNAVSAAGISTPMKLYRGPELTVQGLVANNPPVLKIDLQQLSRFVGRNVEGIIGMPHLAQGKVLLDYDGGFLRVHSGTWNLNGPASQSVDLAKDWDVPVLETNIGKSRCLLAIDTGNGGSLTLERTAFEALVADGWIETTLARERNLSLSGVSSQQRGWFLKGQLMGKELRGVAVSSVDGMGLMGLEWLSAFNIEFDFAARKCRYQVRENAAPPLDIPMMTGAMFTYDAAGAHVERLSPGKRATEAAGIQVGDIIEVFDTLKADQMNAVAIAEKVTAKAGQPVEIHLLQITTGERTMVTLQLPPPISSWNFSRRQMLNAK